MPASPDESTPQSPGSGGSLAREFLRFLRQHTLLWLVPLVLLLLLLGGLVMLSGTAMAPLMYR